MAYLRARQGICKCKFMPVESGEMDTLITLKLYKRIWVYNSQLNYGFRTICTDTFQLLHDRKNLNATKIMRNNR